MAAAWGECYFQAAAAFSLTEVVESPFGRIEVCAEKTHENGVLMHLRLVVVAKC